MTAVSRVSAHCRVPDEQSVRPRAGTGQPALGDSEQPDISLAVARPRRLAQRN